MSIIEVFSHRLRLVREKRGLSQHELGRRCGFSSNQINRYEKHLIEPTISSLHAISRELDVSADYLLGFAPESNNIPEQGYVEASEEELLSTFRREGWPGVFRLGANYMSK